MRMRHGMARDVKNLTFPGKQSRCQNYQPQPSRSEEKRRIEDGMWLHAIRSKGRRKLFDEDGTKSGPGSA